MTRLPRGVYDTLVRQALTQDKPLSLVVRNLLILRLPKV